MFLRVEVMHSRQQSGAEPWLLQRDTIIAELFLLQDAYLILGLCRLNSPFGLLQGPGLNPMLSMWVLR